MSDGIDLAATAVGIISAAAGSAAAGIGTAAGRLVTDLVRSRLQSVPDGPAAVTAVEDNPQDPSAQARLTDVLAQALAADPDFRAALAQNVALSRTVPPPPPPGSINIGAGATVKNSNFALRDVVVNHIRHTNNSTLAIYAIGLVVLLALAAYGGANLLADTGSPSPGRAAASQGQAAEPPAVADPGQPSATTLPSAPHAATSLTDPALVKAILPDQAAMPPGWTLDGVATVDPSCPGCVAGVRYTGPASLSFAVSSHSSTAEAKEDFEAHGFGKAPNIQLDMPGVGDQRVGTRGFSLNQVPGNVITVVRVGSLELTVQEFKSSSPAGDDDVATVLAVTRMFAERARQAQNGQTPTARTQQ